MDGLNWYSTLLLLKAIPLVIMGDEMNNLKWFLVSLGGAIFVMCVICVFLSHYNIMRAIGLSKRRRAATNTNHLCNPCLGAKKNAGNNEEYKHNQPTNIKQNEPLKQQQPLQFATVTADVDVVVIAAVFVL